MFVRALNNQNTYHRALSGVDHQNKKVKDNAYWHVVEPSIALIKIRYAMDIYLDPAHVTYIQIQPTLPLSA